MGQWWDAAVAAAGEQPPADLSAAVAEELIALWSDLGEAIRRAGGRSWSVECDGLVVRIVMLSRLTAATPWPWIPAPLLASGVYQGILQSAGIAFTAPRPAEIHDVNLARGAGEPGSGGTGPGTLADPGAGTAGQRQVIPSHVARRGRRAQEGEPGSACAARQPPGRS